MALPKSGNGADELKRCDKNKYLRLLGKLVFIPERSRPDIGFAVSYGSSRNANPTEEDWERLLRIVAYLKHTKDLALTYRQDPRARGDGTINKELVKVVAYCDASYNLYEDGKSQSGYVIAFPTGDNAEDKAAVHARSFKQGRITLSSTESELEAVFELVKEIKWWRNFLEEIGFEQGEATTIYEDNKSTIQLCTNFSGNMGKTKHYILRIKYVNQQVQEQQEIELKYIESDDNISDILTKASFSSPLFARLCRQMLGLEESG
jgi:hypothetical protein